jgi:hypothetical protein
MKTRHRILAAGIAATAFSLVLIGRADADGGHFIPPVTDPVVKEECGSCHLAFSPAMLPAASWRRLMDGLGQHFGTDASVAPATADHIRKVLTMQAADAGGARYGGGLMRGIGAGQAPLRITELPGWARIHHEVRARDWLQPDVKTKSNCVACHADAPRGYFED